MNPVTPLPLEEIIPFSYPSECTRKIASLFFAAFEQKLCAVFQGKEKGLDFVQQNLNPERIVPLFSGEELVGVMGLEFGGKTWIDPSWSQLWGFYAWKAFSVAFWGLPLMHRPDSKTLCIDSIAVHPLFRGRGAGSHLLEWAFAFAQKKDYRSVSLYVVHSNDKARKLYERLGFQVKKERHVPFPWSKRLGFSSAFLMERPV